MGSQRESRPSLSALKLPDRHRIEELIVGGALAVGDGYRAKNEELSNTGIPFARAANINNGFHFVDADRFPLADLRRVGEKISRPGDVVFTSKGTVGRFAYVSEETPRFVFSPQLCYWRSLDASRIDSRFLYYWLSGPEFFAQYTSVKAQTDMADYVSLRDQRKMWMTLPSLREQRAIADVLGALDDKIELYRRMNETLEGLGRLLHAEVLRSSCISEQLGDVVEINALKRLRDFDHTTIEYVDISSVTVGRLDSVAEHAVDAAPSRAQRLVRDGDTIWSCVRPNRRSYLFIVHPPDHLVVSTGFAVLTPRRVPSAFLYFSVTTDDFVDYLAANADGSAYPAVRSDHFEHASIAVPSEDIVREFETAVRPMLNRIAHNERESRTLAELRDTLLPKLISGELRVRDAEAAVDRAP